MTRTEAIQYARDLWPLFNKMKREEWRDHARNEARNRGEGDQWTTGAVAWLEAAFTFAKTYGK